MQPLSGICKNLSATKRNTNKNKKKERKKEIIKIYVHDATTDCLLLNVINFQKRIHKNRRVIKT